MVEALVQRGACASWTPKNLGSRLIMFACRWMVANTNKRLFVAYADPEAGEYGTLYQACNWQYLGNKWGACEFRAHPGYKNGKTFTQHDLRRTGILKQWLRAQGIEAKPEYFKANGFKDLKAIPAEIKSAWYQWGTDLWRSARHVKTNLPKGKYCLILGTNRKEQEDLEKRLKLPVHPYPKRPESDQTDCPSVAVVPAALGVNAAGGCCPRNISGEIIRTATA